MLRLLLATARPQSWQTFTAALRSDPEVHLEYAASGAAALEAVRAGAPHLVIMDTGLPDTGPLPLVQKLLTVNAMVNTAVVSPLTETEFHEASEGLGVLSRLPDTPGESEAVELLAKLKKVLGGTG
ncbi:MAG: response regulator [Deltaproteobacteria bacterium]|jgi:CheY-like chemotaxis protein